MIFNNFLNNLYLLFHRIYHQEKYQSIDPNQLINRHIKDLNTYFNKNQNEIYYSKDQIEDIRTTRLRALLSYAKSNSPWYKKTLADIDVDHFTTDRLKELPTINKTILMEHWDEIVTDSSLSLALVEDHVNKKNEKIDTLYLLSQYHAISTGGSSGKRGIFVFNWEEWIIFYMTMIRYSFHGQERKNLLNKLGAHAKIVFLGVTNTAVAAYALTKTFIQHNENLYFLPMATTPLNVVITRLNKIRPDSLIAPPSYIQKICQLVQEGKIHIQPKIITVSAEPLFEPTKMLIKKTWPRVDIFNIFANSEGIVGLNCKPNRDEMHLNDDYCIVEPLDEKNCPVPKGVMATKAYITNLYNYTLPLIRYENPDNLLFLDKSCDCGLQHQLIQTPTGKPAYDFNFPNNIFVHHSLFLGLLLTEKNVREYQVIQTLKGFDIKILANESFDSEHLKDSVDKRLCQIGFCNAEINIIEVSEIIYLTSGKLNRFVPLSTS